MLADTSQASFFLNEDFVQECQPKLDTQKNHDTPRFWNIALCQKKTPWVGPFKANTTFLWQNTTAYPSTI